MSVIDSFGMLIAKKWIAGEDLQHAIQEAKRINSHKESVIMNYLGEDLEVPNKYEVTCKSGFKSPQPQTLFFYSSIEHRLFIDK